MSAKVSAEVVTMTPKEASQILEQQKDSPTKNRHLSQGRVEQYAATMKEDKWKLNGQPIVLDQNDQLLDGQHRLWACVVSDTPFRTLLVRGVDRDVFPTLDTGKPRSGGDVLSMMGYTNVNVLSSALSWLYLYEQKKLLWHAIRAGWTNGLQFVLISQHPHVLDSVQWANRARRNHILRAIPSAAMSFMHYVFSRYSEDLCEQFFNRVGDIGDDRDAQDSSTRTLRTFLIRSLKEGKASTQELIALCVKAWGAHVGKRPCKSLTWRRFGPSKEDFPIFPGDEESRGAATRTTTLLTLEDGIKFLKERLAAGPVETRKLKAEAKAKGIPIHQIEGSASLKKAIGIVTARVKNRYVWSLKESAPLKFQRETRELSRLLSAK